MAGQTLDRTRFGPAAAVAGASAHRRIGPWGTAGRAALGSGLVGSVVVGHAARGWHVVPWVLGLVVFPSVIVGLQAARVHGRRERLVHTGPLAHVLNVVVFLALYLTSEYAPALGATSDAALVFYGTSMLLAAARGMPGCEVLVVSNWLLRRDDRIGCALFGPVDALERHREEAADTANTIGTRGSSPSGGTSSRWSAGSPVNRRPSES